ncbi:hypothetical protein [Streptomyces sp. 150FB]|uniref:hypothetical protein n=1 Tax=Streptomyces sp. 150FB TaxID=1576605 RepID=UPI000ADE74FC|nr:hypothetical protein [Streptomyces sp. 150FB]
MGFADRLTKPHNGEEDREQLRKLMVNAFLEDLRVAYRRRFWRPRGARRTTYCVAFLRGVGDTDCGYMTLRSIIDVRNETGAFDPLVVVTSGTRGAALAAGMYGEWDDQGPARPGPDRYPSWKDDFLHAGRERTRTTWYLPLAVTARTGAEVVPGARRSRDRLDRLRPIEAAAPAWWARRWVSVTVVCLMVAALAGTAGWGVGERARWTADHCGLSPAEADAATLLTARGGQCVGVAPNGFAFGTEDPSLKAVLSKIAGLNRAAEAANREHGRRPLITLVHLSALLSSAGRSPVDLAYSREALQGAAIAQKRQLDKHGETDPVLRIFPANAGTDMRYGKQVVDILERMRKDDPTIVGVTGIDQSRRETVDTIRKLTRVGLPMMGTITSADSLTDVSALYFQVSPQNRREASVAAAYADAHRARLGIEKKIRTVYSADAADSYSGNLNADIGNAFRKKGFEVEQQAYTLPNPAPGSQGHPALRVVGERSCDYPGLVFFAGRSEHFEQLLEGVNQACRSHPPVILGGDDVARLVADPGRSGRFPALDYDFLDFTLESASCEGESDLYTGMRELFHEECVLVKDSSLDGHASLAFDAVNLFVKAVGRLQDSAPGLPLSATAVWHGLSGIHGDAALDGESGRIDFGGQVDQQVPLDKLITVQHVEGAARPEQVGLCGRYGDREQDLWCPALRIAPRK